MRIVRRQVVIQNKAGLHARPAANFVQIANQFLAEITVTKGVEAVNGKSIMGILMLGAGRGDTIQIEATGEDAPAAIERLIKVVLQDEEPVLKKIRGTLLRERKGRDDPA